MVAAHPTGAPVRTDHRVDSDPNPDEAACVAVLAAAHADGDVPSEFNTRLASDPEPWSLIYVTVTYISPVLPNGTIMMIADGGDGHGRVLVVADGQDLAEAQGWLTKGRIRLAGRRTELLGTVGFDIRRAVA